MILHSVILLSLQWNVFPQHLIEEKVETRKIALLRMCLCLTIFLIKWKFMMIVRNRNKEKLYFYIMWKSDSWIFLICAEQNCQWIFKIRKFNGQPVIFGPRVKNSSFCILLRYHACYILFYFVFCCMYYCSMYNLYWSYVNDYFRSANSMESQLYSDRGLKTLPFVCY